MYILYSALSNSLKISYKIFNFKYQFEKSETKLTKQISNCVPIHMTSVNETKNVLVRYINYD